MERYGCWYDGFFRRPRRGNPRVGEFHLSIACVSQCGRPPGMCGPSGGLRDIGVQARDEGVRGRCKRLRMRKDPSRHTPGALMDWRCGDAARI